MTKRQWFLVAGTLVLAACHGTGTGVCVNTMPSAGAYRSADEVGLVECYDTQTGQPAEAPAPRVNEPNSNEP